MSRKSLTPIEYLVNSKFARQAKNSWRHRVDCKVGYSEYLSLVEISRTLLGLLVS